jgi:TPP-dependent indolepyruvate ferredoxin oxidoreductase alpha subunit
MKTTAPSAAKRLLSGNEAIALGAWEAGVRYAAAYPGTPSTEILPALAQHAGVQVEWSSNEKAALDVAAGASFAGAGQHHLQPGGDLHNDPGQRHDGDDRRTEQRSHRRRPARGDDLRDARG